MNCKVSLAAVGDISFMGRNADNPTPTSFGIIGETVGEAGVVIGNLESPLVANADPVMGKCTLRGSRGWAEVMKKAGISVLSLANNHMMDFGEIGLLNTIRSLRKAGIIYAGAGKNRKEACAPVFFDVSGKRIALISRTLVAVSSPSYARENTPGVAFLDVEETKSKIRLCKRLADIIILSIHWGLENYSFPSPSQRLLAMEMVSAGANIIFGHHPHVLQGMEQIGSALVVYSLGNFIFDEVEWYSKGEGFKAARIVVPLFSANRQGMILRLEWNNKERPECSSIYTQVSDDGTVELDLNPNRQSEAKAVSKKLRHPFYRAWWHIYAAKREWELRIRPRVSVRKVARNLVGLDLKKLKEVIETTYRSAKVAAGRSTNPYE